VRGQRSSAIKRAERSKNAQDQERGNALRGQIPEGPSLGKRVDRNEMKTPHRTVRDLGRLSSAHRREA